MSNLKQIAYNCKQATFLIEKKQITKLSWTEKFELRFHLAGCSVCKRYEKQSIFITQLAMKLFLIREEPALKLDDGFKKQLQQRIEKELNQN